MSGPPEADFVEGRVARLLDRAGVPQRQRVTYVAQALALGYQLARRRMIGETPWTVNELARLADSCGETLTTLFADDGSSEAFGNGVSAEFALGSVRIPCRVWVGAKAASRKTTPLVAIQPVKDQWVVVPATDALEADAFEVERMLIQLTEAKKHRVAVLDDDKDVARSIVDYMGATGLDARAFFSLDALMNEIEESPFDGYVVDWLIAEQNASALIAAIRAKDSACPIVLLTGQIETGNADEGELASIASSYRLTYFEKPIRTSSLLSALRLGFVASIGD